jgi:hypothetical protein
LGNAALKANRPSPTTTSEMEELVRKITDQVMAALQGA